MTHALAPQRVRTSRLDAAYREAGDPGAESPMSPYGFGGTTGEEGRPVTDDYAGSGGGTANPDFCAALAAGDGSDGATSPLATLRGFYVKPGCTFTEERSGATWTCWPPASATTSIPETPPPHRPGRTSLLGRAA